MGNLSVGGTGKTPHIEYLIRFLLEEGYQLSTLSRGYGRKTKGLIIADKEATAMQIGDEPMQFYRKFGKEVPVAVGEERIMAIPHLIDQHPEIEVILLDDAYQHRKLRPSFHILLTEYAKPFYKDYLLPTGMLREGRVGAKRADIVIMTKCPEQLPKQDQERIRQQVSKYTQTATPIYFTKIQYGAPQLIGKQTAHESGFFVVTGIANPKPLLDFLATHNQLKAHKAYKDHHSYTTADIQAVLEECPANTPILLTEKDAVKWESEELKPVWHERPVYYLPIEVSFLDKEDDFQKNLMLSIKNTLNKV